MKYILILTVALVVFTGFIASEDRMSEEELHRLDYVSSVDNQDRSYFVYLPKGYHSQPDRDWPVMLFLHGNGERGNGQEELDYVLSHGPVYEAWIQKKDIPFIIISPQLHMFDFDQRGLGYIDDRKPSQIPTRLVDGVPARPDTFAVEQLVMRNTADVDMTVTAPLLPLGWEEAEQDLLNMLNTVQQKYRTDVQKTYLTGLSYGGFGTWFMASKYPERFAAIAPVVGWGHPSFMATIAEQQLPVWQFAGGLDSAVEIQYFYAGIAELKKLGHNHVRFTVHEDMEHDAWTRVYASDDFYQWLLKHSLPVINQ